MLYSLFITIFIILFSISAKNIPIIPDKNPSIIVSALNIFFMSFLLAPKLFNIPISLVRSKTLIYVIIDTIIDDTIKDIVIKPIRI